MNPIDGKGGDTYILTKHQYKKQYLYIRPSDMALVYFVDATGDETKILHFPTGLVYDTTLSGVWDFSFKYGHCPERFSNIRTFLTKNLMNQPVIPENGLRGSEAVGGVRALFRSTGKKVA